MLYTKKLRENSRSFFSCTVFSAYYLSHNLKPRNPCCLVGCLNGLMGELIGLPQGA